MSGLPASAGSFRVVGRKLVSADMDLAFRHARGPELPALVRMLVDDALGKLREDLSDPIDPCYLRAFAEIEKDPNNELIVAENGEQLVGMLQITFIPYLTYRGAWRCLIEGVRIHADFRGQGLGGRLLEYAIGRARERECAIVQLTSDKNRKDALRFYHQLGFTDSHEGFKLRL